MAETYIKIASEDGSIHISENVIAFIVSTSVADIKGFGGFANVTGTDLAGAIGRKAASKGIRVAFDEGIVSVDVCINVKYGSCLSDVARDVQNAASTAVESMTGIRPVVNVHVSGIAMDR